MIQQKNKKRLDNKTALIIGASSDIGRAVAELYLHEGAHVTLAGRNEKKLQSISEKFHCQYTVLDVTLDSSFNSLPASGFKLDILVNLAGVWHDDERSFFGLALNDYSWDAVNKILSTGIQGSVHCAYFFSPRMNTNSKIIFTSSQFNEHSAKGCAPYYAACKSVEVVTGALALEFADSKIGVYCIAPSYIATAPCKRFFPKQWKEAMLPKCLAEYYVQAALGCYTSGEIIRLKK